MEASFMIERSEINQLWSEPPYSRGYLCRIRQCNAVASELTRTHTSFLENNRL